MRAEGPQGRPIGWPGSPRPGGVSCGGGRWRPRRAKGWHLKCINVLFKPGRPAVARGPTSASAIVNRSRASGEPESGPA